MVRSRAALNVTMKPMLTGEELESFVADRCTQIATGVGGWESLFLDRESKELWVRTFPQSEMHGGGQPVLSPITAVEARERFGA